VRRKNEGWGILENEVFIDRDSGGVLCSSETKASDSRRKEKSDEKKIRFYYIDLEYTSFHFFDRPVIRAGFSRSLEHPRQG